MDSNQVLIDARVTVINGIGRYTHNIVRALVTLLPCQGIDALELLLRSNDLQQYSSYRRFDTSEHYTYAELQCLADAAEQTTALLLHCTDYRVPLHPLNMPLVVSIHDFSCDDGEDSQSILAHRYGQLAHSQSQIIA